jgi:hypothetical protein
VKSHVHPPTFRLTVLRLPADLVDAAVLSVSELATTP